MGTTGAGRLAGLSLMLSLLAAAARSEEPGRLLAEQAAPATSAGTSAPSAAGAEMPTPTLSSGPAPDPQGTTAVKDGGTAAATSTRTGSGAGAGIGTGTATAEAVRAETVEALKRLSKPLEQDSPASAATAKALREVFEERLHWLDEWDKVRAERARQDAEPSPERQAAELKAAVERVKTLLDQTARDPNALLPAAFTKPAGQLTDAARAEMKEALEVARGECTDWKAKLEKARAEDAREPRSQTPLRIERDKVHQRVAALTSRQAERESAITAARTPDEAMLARARLVTFAWESQVESERLAYQERLLAGESVRSDLALLKQQVLDAHVQLATRILGRMEERYRRVSDAQELNLKQAAASEQKRAARADDPVEKYRARRTAELLELQAQVLKFENALATTPSPGYEEQHNLADKADTDYEGVKALLADGSVSHLDALRLNNDFRRIGPERAWIVSHELARTALQLAFYENALSSVEMDLYDDTRTDRLQNEDLLQRLPRARHREAAALFQEFDARRLELLKRKRLALEKLARRTELTHQEIERHLKTLDDHYGFVRTHIFWVRDQEPIGAVTVAQCQRELAIVGRSMLSFLEEACDRSLWGRTSPEFIVSALALLVLPWPLFRLRKSLQPCRPEPPLRTSLLGLLRTALCPGYLLLAAYAARQGPWPRSFAMATALVLASLSVGTLTVALGRRLLRRGGWAERYLLLTARVARQLEAALLAVVGAGVLLLVPEILLRGGLIAANGRAVAAPATCQLLVLAFELIVWMVVFRLVRTRSALVEWLSAQHERLGWLRRHRRPAAAAMLAAIGLVIVLDARGFSYTARRLALGAGQTLLLLAFCQGLYRMILRAIDLHAWRWIRVGHAHGSSGAYARDRTSPGADGAEDPAARLGQLAGYLVPLVGLFLAAWIWNVDPALFRALGDQTLWHISGQDGGLVDVTLGNATTATIILLLTIAAWRHLSTLFAVAVFPRMPDDPGMRFAVVTLCRYAVLGVGLMAGLSSIHLGPDKIGMILAALGVGLGFGLQEIVSNFVCGIILLLERPIRVGDIVTVSDMTGQVDRINIRATTIINGENQSIIVPNRAFITGDLINWTLKDKIIRVAIKIKTAHGTDPDRVAEALLAVAREDPDVLRNPVASAIMEELSDFAQIFGLYVHVPDPSLAGRVRHRLFSQIQKRFKEMGIAIPLPTQELHIASRIDAHSPPSGAYRFDPPQPTPPSPWLGAHGQPVPAPVEDCHRGVDE